MLSQTLENHPLVESASGRLWSTDLRNNESEKDLDSKVARFFRTVVEARQKKPASADVSRCSEVKRVIEREREMKGKSLPEIARSSDQMPQIRIRVPQAIPRARVDTEIDIQYRGTRRNKIGDRRTSLEALAYGTEPDIERDLRESVPARFKSRFCFWLGFFRGFPRAAADRMKQRGSVSGSPLTRGGDDLCHGDSGI